MSFENIEDSIRALEDVSDAPRLRACIRELEEKLLRKDSAHTKEKGELQDENVRLVKVCHSLESRCTELAGIRVVFQKNRYSLRGIDRIAGERMGKEVKKQIKKQAQKLSEEQLPSLIEGEMKGYPAACSDATRKIVEEKAAQLCDEYLRTPSMWAQWFRDEVRGEVDKQVEKRMDQTFWDSVKSRADQEINYRLPAAWMSFLRGSATSFMMNTLQDQLLSFMASIEYNCPKCEEIVQVTITPDDFSIMLQKGWVSYRCPFCRGFFKKNIRVTLGELFWHIQKGDVIPIVTRVQYKIPRIAVKRT